MFSNITKCRCSNLKKYYCLLISKFPGVQLKLEDTIIFVFVLHIYTSTFNYKLCFRYWYVFVCIKCELNQLKCFLDSRD